MDNPKVAGFCKEVLALVEKYDVDIFLATEQDDMIYRNEKNTDSLKSYLLDFYKNQIARLNMESPEENSNDFKAS